MTNRLNPMRTNIAIGLALTIVALMLVACGEESEPSYAETESAGGEGSAVTVPALAGTAIEGEELFVANCSQCHGLNAVGTSQGPPLLHKVYVPGHHPDLSFQNAVRNGVWQHHWNFGEMPPVGTVTPQEVDKVICYVREMQRANGIFERDTAWTTC